ncbi:MAG: F0F1 ATP synthase subunit alpha [Candidatus Sungbacteria bacterium RIFCSPLOWO2_01_FULL_47_32]|nr:MAG: ATP synthase subunit alpha [Parcubacteria group bacterium GW2011_GWA2_47_10]OHA06123.1 MAG: F0F1 ATP synthase subunit alpha [Candidatus Sungbacteria bacterium RIFCSPLOWO2_01_FULL_47_32]
MSKEIIEKIKQEISGFKSEIKTERVGKVFEVGDGVCRMWGLSSVMAQEMVEIETDGGGVNGIALNLEEDSVGVVILGDFLKVKEGNIVRGTGRVLSVRVGKEMVGRVVNALGEPADGRGPIFASEKDGKFYPVEKIAPGVITRESVNTPLHTGIKAIDAMIPIGRGQRELIIGDRQIGKSAIAIDAIVNQQNDTGRRTPFCIYVAVGQRDSKVAKIVAELEKKGAMKYTVVVAASASSPASLQYLAPFTGAAIGEFFMDQGEDALVIYDDLTKHANAYRQISLLLRRPPGREAFPGDIFYLHSRLLERAAKLSKEYGGGSLTALPIIETQLGDVSAYIPTNVISITDGQIYLEPDLFYQGVRPAVNVGLSVSRVGSAAQTQAMKKVAGRLRLDLAQFRELQAFVQFATDLDEATKKRIVRGQVLTELLKQNDFEPMPFERQVVVLYAGVNGYLDGIELPEIQNFQKKFLDYIDKMHKGILEAIAKSGELAVDVEEKLKRAIEETRKM